MKIIEYIIEWVGILFLSVEAIKIENFKSLTKKLEQIRRALNPKYLYDEITGEYKGKETLSAYLVENIDNKYRFEVPKIYAWLMKYRTIILYITGCIVILFLLSIFHLMPETLLIVKNYIFVFSGVSIYRIILSIFLIYLLLWIPFMIGNQFISYFTLFCAHYAKLMNRLEKNTYNGIIGIIGFILISISLFIKIIIE